MSRIYLVMFFLTLISAVGCGRPSEVSELNRMLLKCGLPEIADIEDVRQLDRSATKLGNSGHKTIRAKLPPAAFSRFLKEASSTLYNEPDFDIAVSDLGLTIDPDQATIARSQHFQDGGGILVVAEESQQVIEVVLWW